MKKLVFDAKKTIGNVYEHWNSKKIIVHKRLTHDIELAIAGALRYYTLDEILSAMDFYATILEPELSLTDKESGGGKYWWSYRWTLRDFLRRGVPKFDGQIIENYQRRQSVASPEAIVIKRRS